MKAYNVIKPDGNTETVNAKSINAVAAMYFGDAITVKRMFPTRRGEYIIGPIGKDWKNDIRIAIIKQ